LRAAAAIKATGSGSITLLLMLAAFVAFVLGCLAVSGLPGGMTQENQMDALEANVVENVS
jgi:small-conductance mechanosensitive channel